MGGGGGGGGGGSSPLEILFSFVLRSGKDQKLLLAMAWWAGRPCLAGLLPAPEYCAAATAISGGGMTFSRDGARGDSSRIVLLLGVVV